MTTQSNFGSTIPADNCVEIVGGAYGLGGNLIRPTALNTSVINTLAITGLQNGDPVNDFTLVIDAAGILRFLPATAAADFFRSGTAAAPLIPDGVTDLTDKISRSGDMGLGNADPSTVAARLDITGAQVLRPIALADFAANAAIGAAAATVDVTSHITLSQTTAGRTLTIPAPTNTQAGRLLIVESLAASTVPVTVGGQVIQPSTGVPFVWSGAAWVPLGAAAADFWRGGTGATLPDGTTDPTDAIARTGNVGIGIANPTTLAGALDVTGSMILRPVNVANLAAGGAVGTAAATVDIASVLVLAQTTANQALTLPNPTNAQAGRILFVTHNGTAATTVNGIRVSPGESLMCVWDGNTWNTEKGATITEWLVTGNTGTINTGYADAAAQTNNFIGTLDNIPWSAYTNAASPNAKTDLKLYTATSSAAAITAPVDVFHIRRNGQSGVVFPQIMTVALGHWFADVNSRTRADIKLGNGNTTVAESTVMSLFSQGGVVLNANGGSIANYAWAAAGAPGKNGIAGALLNLTGSNGSVSGPHFAATTATDNYPLFYQLNWQHDNVALNFDGYYDGAWRHSHTSRSYSIYKLSDQLRFYGSAAAGVAGTPWPQDLMMAMRYAGATLAGGELWFNNVVKNRRIVLWDTNAASDHEFYGFGINASMLRQQVVAGASFGWYVSSSATTSNELMRLTTLGRLGLGTNGPSALLHVSGPNANGRAAPLFRVTDTNIAGSYFAVDNGAAANAYRLIAVGSNLELQAQNNNNQLFLSTNGSVGIGTNAPTAGLGNLSVNANGFKPGGGAWGVFSDRRIKKDVKPFTPGLAAILALQPVEFRYNGKAGSVGDGKRYVSLIAQDTRDVLPDFVEEHEISGEVYSAMSKADQKLFADKTILGLKEGLTNFEAVLINAVKELSAQNALLSDRIAALEARLT